MKIDAATTDEILAELKRWAQTAARWAIDAGLRGIGT